MAITRETLQSSTFGIADPELPCKLTTVNDCSEQYLRRQ